ncbi:MAG TPA: hypothetical protein VFH81_01485 [Actinomycetota bacterium]|nr:hypothetical protein [Actinomycetota bacterium]
MNGLLPPALGRTKMPAVGWERAARTAAALMGSVIVLGLAAPSVRAATEGPRVDGTASGELARGARLVLRIDAAEVGGWPGLQRLDLSLLTGGRAVETITYDVERQQLIIGEQEVFAGSGGLVTGSYLRVSGAQVVVTTGGANLSLAATAAVLRSIPSDARFLFSATDDAGLTSSVTRPLEAGNSEGGVSWGTVIATVCVALLGGAFLGNLFASSRRPPPRLSVYSSIQRRIDEERRAKTSAP